MQKLGTVVSHFLTNLMHWYIPVLITLGAHARSEGYCSCHVCVCMCVSALICRLTHWNHKREIPTDSSQYRNHFIFFANFAKNGSFKSYGVICSPRAAPAS